VNQSKFDSVYREMTVQAKKVYDCIPIAESWNPAQIMGELHRRNISMSDKHVVMGCINSMIDAGVINEVERGMFKREAVRPKCEIKEIEVINKPKEIEVKQNALANSEKMGTVSDGPIYILSTLASRLRVLAIDIDNAAISLAEREEKTHGETEKLRQLQALLKSLG
jgi:hypothetical protein